MLNRFLALSPAALVVAYGLWIGPAYDRYVLPAFDGFVYDAMADHPKVFTLAPWGYRILTPWIVHFLPFPSPAVGFFWLNLVLLAAAAFAVGAWLRRIGFSPVAAFAGSLSLAITPPFHAMLEYQVLVDPMSLMVYVATLIELTNPGALALAALLAVGALTKEVCLLILLVLPFVMSARLGWKRGLLASAGIAAPALVLFLFLRATWGTSPPGFHLAPPSIVLGHIMNAAREYPAFFALVTLVGFRGFVLEKTNQIRAMAVILWFACFLAVLANPYGFSVPDLLRIAPFAWTPFLPLFLQGLGFSRDPPRAAPAGDGRVRNIAALAALSAAAILTIQTDSYRRAPTPASPEPVSFLARHRESLKIAQLLEEGRPFTFDSRSGRYAGPIVEPFNLTEGRLHRWFLLEGFGAAAELQSGPPVFQGEARLLLPVLVPRTMSMSIEFEGPAEARIRIAAAGQEVASIPTGAAGGSFQIPDAILFRGDNILHLTGPAQTAVRLIRFEARVLP